MAKKLEEKKVGAVGKSSAKPASKPVAKEVEVVGVASVIPASSRKYLGTLGAKRVLSITKKLVGGVEYNEIMDEACATFLLSDRDLKEQLKPLE